MQWWARSRLRTKIFLAFSTLILVLFLLTLGLTQLMVGRLVQNALTDELVVTGEVFRGLIAERAARLLIDTRLLAGDFALKQAIVESEYDPQTLASVARNYQQRIGVDLFLITDDEGVLLADSFGTQSSGREIDTMPPLAQAIDTEEAATALAELNGSLFQLVAIPLLAPDAIGFLVLGSGIDNATAEQLQKDTGLQISFLTQERLFASSWSKAGQRQLFSTQSGPQAISQVLQSPAGEPFVLMLENERFLSLLVPMSAQLPLPLYTLVQSSYDEALAPLSALRWRIAGIGLVAVIGALLLGSGLAGGITSPVQTLIASMQQILTGNFQHRIPVDRQDEIGVLAESFNEMAGGLEEREQIKETFGRFVSQDVADAVLSGRVPMGGERREVSILFQDIRGFTTISEQTDPAQLVHMLNLFFTEMVAAVEAEGGIVKQFTGDGVMALFGAPVAYPDGPARAVRAALGMLDRLDDLNPRLNEQNLPTLRIGVGIHTGEVVAGRIGPDKRVEYAVVGDPVNLASRIEGLTKEMQATIVISQETASRLDANFVFGRTAMFSVKGKAQPVQVVEVLGNGQAEPVR